MQGPRSCFRFPPRPTRRWSRGFSGWGYAELEDHRKRASSWPCTRGTAAALVLLAGPRAGIDGRASVDLRGARGGTRARPGAGRPGPRARSSGDLGGPSGDRPGAGRGLAGVLAAVARADGRAVAIAAAAALGRRRAGRRARPGGGAGPGVSRNGATLDGGPRPGFARADAHGSRWAVALPVMAGAARCRVPAAPPRGPAARGLRWRPGPGRPSAPRLPPGCCCAGACGGPPSAVRALPLLLAARRPCAPAGAGARR